MLQSSREYELKLDLTAGELDRLAQDPRLGSKTTPTQKKLRTVYFDTPDYRLHARGIVLRVRHDGNTYIQTVKLDNDLKDGISNPIEVEDRLENGEPDLSRIHDIPVRRQVLKAIEGSSLVRAFETVMTRTAYKLRRRGSLIELALDRGRVVARNRKCEICEAELELIRGKPGDLLQAALSLFAKSAIRLPGMTKAERGYRLLLKTPPAVKAGPVHAVSPAIVKGQSCGEAFASIVRSAREQIVGNRTAVLETDEPEAVHQLRVGLTRLRSAQRALTKALPGSPQLRRLETDARTISRAVGRLRDADVMTGEICAPVAAKEPRQPDFTALQEALKAHRDAAQKEARKTLIGEAWTRLLLGLTFWPSMLEQEPCLQEPVESLADKLLQSRWKKTAELGRSIDRLDGEEQHRMRRLLKKLRYTAEFLAPLFRKAKTNQFIGRLKKLQDVFGYVNDVRMAGELSVIAKAHRGGPEALAAAGVVLRYHEAEAAEVWQRAPKAWRRLKARGPFWK